MEGLDLESLDAPEAEILNAPEPVVEAPVPPPGEPAPEPPAPVVEEATRARDPETGKFVARPAEPVAPAAPASAAPPTPTPEAPQKVIPLAAHLEERSRWRQEMQASQARLDQIQRELETLKPKAPEPDFLEDPKGYVDSKTAEASKQVEDLKREAEGLRQQQAFSAFREQVATAEASFIEKTPDYYDAINHSRSLRIAQLADFYPEANEVQIRQAVAMEEIQFAAACAQQGRNPAEVAYKNATTYGYRRAEPKAAAPKIPLVPKAPVADPSDTLGSAGADNPAELEELSEDDMLPLQQALRERFGSKGG